VDRIPYTGKEKELLDAFNFIQQNVPGNIIIATGTPTLATMKANTTAKYGNDLYIKFADGTGIVLAGVALT